MWRMLGIVEKLLGKHIIGIEISTSLPDKGDSKTISIKLLQAISIIKLRSSERKLAVALFAMVGFEFSRFSYPRENFSEQLSKKWPTGEVRRACNALQG